DTYGSSDVSQTDAGRALPEHPSQGDVRDVRSRSRRVHVLRQVRCDGVLVRRDATWSWSRRDAGAARLLHWRAGLLQALSARAVWDRWSHGAADTHNVNAAYLLVTLRLMRP